MGHATFAHAVNTWIYPNASRSSGYGSTISYISGDYLGDVFVVSPPAPSCNTGTHIHVEARSSHDYGGIWEWRSNEGPDAFDFPSAQVHGGNGAYGAFATPDDTSWGQVVGYIGGSTYSPAMWDNVFYSDH